MVGFIIAKLDAKMAIKKTHIHSSSYVRNLAGKLISLDVPHELDDLKCYLAAYRQGYSRIFICEMVR